QGKQLLIARRLVERGVRFVQVWASGWDHHNDLADRLRAKAGEIDGPAAALLTDLKQRGMLDSTLVIWGGEFGRKPTRDKNGNDDPGRDHNNRAFAHWLAGGGVKGGVAYGATDEFGARAVENKVHIHDYHATLLALMGFDHEKLTYRYNGRDFRLTDNFGHVVKGIIA
ncbi:MAG: sulfatase, partial [Pedosphaera sp. Tous-C6FEB]